MFKILVDTCVWIDIAGDPDQHSLLGVLEELIRMNELSLIVPKTIIDEFDRNKPNVVRAGSKSLAETFKRVKEVVDKFGDPRKKKKTLEQLNEVNHKIPLLGDSVLASVKQIETLLKHSETIEINEGIKLKAGQRAIDKRAPFHRNKNSMNDAILIESYDYYIKNESAKGTRYAFVTHNRNDFSDPAGNHKDPHPDFKAYFSKVKSLYFINLAEALHRIGPHLVSDLMIEHEFSFEPRSLTEILKSESELCNKVWYNRHKWREYQISKGKIKIIKKDQFSIKNSQNTIVDEIWQGALKSAKKLEDRYGKENMGPWDDFEWGMINGKLSALRWVIGDEWDELYT